MNRRHFLTTLAGAMLAPKVGVAPAIGSFRGYMIPGPAPEIAPITRALTNAKLDEIYAMLQQSAAAAWTERHRESYAFIAAGCPSHHVSNAPLALGPVRVDGEAG